MSRYKKTISMLLMSTLIVSLAGCSKNNQNDKNNNQNNTNTEINDNTNANGVTTQEIEATVIGVGAFQRQIMEALNVDDVESVYDMDYQAKAYDLIEGYKADNTYTLENPLFILNPYGTNRTGLYTYFTTKEAANITYTISVEDEAISDFTATLYSNDDASAVTEHEGQIIGLIQGMENTITFDVTADNGDLLASTQYVIKVPDFGTLDKLYFEATEMNDVTNLSNGLFTLLDYDLQDAEEYSHILIVDNTGVIRAELIIDVIKNNPVIEFINGNIVYSYDMNQLACMNRFGQIVRTYDLGQYNYHHDMEYNPSNDTLMILADDTTRDTIEELVISLDMKSGDVTLVADFEVLMNDIFKRATRPEQNMTYGTELDWIHFNSISFINDTDVLLSARELSSIIRVDNIYENPTISAILADELLWADTAYADLVYAKGNEFSSHAGQHNLTVIHDDSLEDGQYYVTLYNNNWGSAPTWPEFDWSTLEGVNLDRNTITEGNMGSAFYQYLVDDNAKTYTLVNKVELPYSGFVSNATIMENGNIQFASGAGACVFGEYDANGTPIVQFNLSPDSFVGTYRAMKLSYQGFWFN